MRKANSVPAIQCPVGLFGNVEHEIEDITTAINRAPDASEKAALAGNLRAAVSMLLDCKDYESDNTNCRLCREFSELRDKTAALVEQAAKLVH